MPAERAGGENGLMRLAGATTANGEAYFAPHLLQAGLRVARAGRRAALQQRVTMSYSGARTPTRNGSGFAADLSDEALDARNLLNRLWVALPRDCAGVLFDVCVYDKGLQQIEAERQWPRRSAKLVLRIALEQAAGFFGLAATGQGPQTGQPATWRDEDARPTRFE